MPRVAPIYLRITQRNLNSIAAVLAVLEQELPHTGCDIRLASHVDDIMEPGVVLYSFMSMDVPRVGQELDCLRDRFGARLWAMAGGAHASGDPAGAQRMGFRWVAVGEAGPELAALLGSALQGCPPPPGVYRFPPVTDLDRYPPWPRSGRLFAPVEITRGCPMSCAFCQTPIAFGRFARHRSVSALRPAFLQAAATGHSFTRFISPNAFAYGAPDPRHPDPAAVETLLLAARQSGFSKVYFGTFPSEVRPESVRPDLLGLVRALCDNSMVALGIQSGSDDMLKRMRRGHSVREAVRAVELIAAAGLTPRVDFIFGLPGETDADRAKTRDLIRHLRAAHGALVHAHRFTPLPSTPWASERPSRIDPLTRQLIDDLKGTGSMTGIRPHSLDDAS